MILLARIQAWRDRQALMRQLTADVYDAREIGRATAHYVRPECSLDDPAGDARPGEETPSREPLFAAADRALGSPGQQRLILFLAAPGMGKTSFLLNYCARHWRSRRRRRDFRLRLLRLSLPDVDQRIGRIAAGQRPETVLLLDALDEDPKAIDDLRRRVSVLGELTEGFRAVGIACSSEFLGRDPETLTALEPSCRKIFLSPFTDHQIDVVLRKRFGLHRYGKRRDARRLVKAAPSTLARPLLLGHIDAVSRERRSLQYAFQAYEALVEVWLKGVGDDAQRLGSFAERLAADMFLKGTTRGMERIPREELDLLAARNGLSLRNWSAGRSLLDRDATGHYRFIHRSIMEYLFARAFACGDVSADGPEWTDQMRLFFREMWSSGAVTVEGCVAAIRQKKIPRDELGEANLRGADLSDVDLSHTKLRDADLGGSTLRSADLRQSDLADAHLERADMTGARLGQSNLRSADLTNADLTGADLTGADLRGASLVDAKLGGAKLGQADLGGADLARADLTGADVTGAKLTRAKLGEAILDDAELREVDLSLANLRGASLRRTCLGGADLGLADLIGANLSGADLSSANLRSANFRDTKLLGVNFEGANLSSANLTHSSLARANLRNANLSDANLWKADLQDADLRDANLRDATVSIEQVKSARDREGVWLGPQLTEELDPNKRGGIRRYRSLT